jgi:hypothetical protein
MPEKNVVKCVLQDVTDFPIRRLLLLFLIMQRVSQNDNRPPGSVRHGVWLWVWSTLVTDRRYPATHITCLLTFNRGRYKKQSRNFTSELPTQLFFMRKL